MILQSRHHALERSLFGLGWELGVFVVKSPWPLRAPPFFHMYNEERVMNIELVQTGVLSEGPCRKGLCSMWLRRAPSVDASSLSLRQACWRRSGFSGSYDRRNCPHD